MLDPETSQSGGQDIGRAKQPLMQIEKHDINLGFESNGIMNAGKVF